MKTKKNASIFLIPLEIKETLLATPLGLFLLLVDIRTLLNDRSIPLNMREYPILTIFNSHSILEKDG